MGLSLVAIVYLVRRGLYLWRAGSPRHPHEWSQILTWMQATTTLALHWLVTCVWHTCLVASSIVIVGEPNVLTPYPSFPVHDHSTGRTGFTEGTHRGSRFKRSICERSAWRVVGLIGFVSFRVVHVGAKQWLRAQDFKLQWNRVTVACSESRWQYQGNKKMAPKSSRRATISWFCSKMHSLR